MSGMCQYHFRPLPDRSSKSADRLERPTDAATSDLVGYLIEALSEARLAVDALAMNLSTRQINKKSELQRNKMQESF